MSMQNFINEFNNMYKNIVAFGESNDFSSFQIYYTKESFNSAIDDINDEGSGILNINCDTHDTCELFQEFINNSHYNIYVLNIDDTTISLIIDSTFLPSNDDDINNVYEVVDNVIEPECLVNCKCINCIAEKQELEETVCTSTCNCINCYFEKN